MWTAQCLGLAQRSVQSVVLTFERAVVVAPHLPADVQRLLQPLQPLKGGGKEQAEPARFLLVPCRTDAQHRATAGAHTTL